MRVAGLRAAKGFRVLDAGILRNAVSTIQVALRCFFPVVELTLDHKPNALRCKQTFVSNRGLWVSWFRLWGFRFLFFFWGGGVCSWGFSGLRA